MTDNAAEAIEALNRAIVATDEALAAMGSIEQVQSRFEAGILSLIQEPEIWQAAQDGYARARDALHHARGCLEELQSQIAGTQAPQLQSRTWAEQLVALNEKLQMHLTDAQHQTSRFYESVRPVLIDVYLQHATRMPRWTEAWPLDAERAKAALQRLRAGAESLQLDEFDFQLAEFRWDVGWPQQRIASVVGLSQPSVAARLAKFETLLSLEIGAEHVRKQAEGEQFQVTRRHIVASRGTRTPTSELLLESDECTIQLDLLIASGETSASKRAVAQDRGFSLDLLRLESAAQRQRMAKRTITGLAVYFRDRGSVGYFTTQEVAQTVRLLGRLPTEAILQRLRETMELARTPAELIERSNRPR